MVLDAIIVGAGAAGLTASYQLARQGFFAGNNVRILEATNQVGGRMRVWDTNDDHNDNDSLSLKNNRPLNQGAEWIHGSNASETLQRILGPNRRIPPDIATEPYTPVYQSWWSLDSWWSSELYDSEEHVFRGSSSWSDFLAQTILPSAQLELECAVTTIDYSDPRVIRVECDNGKVWETQSCIVTVSLAVWSDIVWIPALPDAKLRALAQVLPLDAGLKAFFSFSEKFYASVGDAFDLLLDGHDPQGDDANFFYDANYGHATADETSTSAVVLGAFINGYYGLRYQDMTDDQEIVETILQQLDAAFDGQASRYFLDSRVQHWTRDRFFQGTYSNHDRNRTYHLIPTLREPVGDNRVFFAGEGLMVDYGFVHTAALSGRRAARDLAQAVTPRSPTITPVPSIDYQTTPSSSTSTLTNSRPTAAPVTRPSDAPSVPLPSEAPSTAFLPPTPWPVATPSSLPTRETSPSTHPSQLSSTAPSSQSAETIAPSSHGTTHTPSNIGSTTSPSVVMSLRPSTAPSDSPNITVRPTNGDLLRNRSSTDVSPRFTDRPSNTPSVEPSKVPSLSSSLAATVASCSAAWIVHLFAVWMLA